MKTLLSLFCLVTYLTCALSANGWPVSLDMACNKALSTVACSFEFTNNGNEDLYLLKRNTPLEGLYSEFVSVSLNGRPLEYEGIYIHRLPPTKDEFVLLKAGESTSATVQITDIFSIDTDGLYTVQYSRPLQYLSVSEMSAMSIDQLRELFAQEFVQIHLEDTSLLLKPKKEEIKVDYTVHLEACGSARFVGNNQNYATLHAHQHLCSSLLKAETKVGYGIPISAKWFGAYSYHRTAVAKNVYQKIRYGITTKTVTYYNNGPQCRPNSYAYTYKGSTTVYLCPVYYRDQILCSTTGESKEGTLVHEWSHAFGYTDDIVYGRPNSLNLARYHPDNAVRNAESYCYHYCDARFF
ncbi:PREDICTED: uncharacterized protein LOC105314155 isoform X1 [Amphimedon queenslandica]|uniref:Lysine-specific metallo-endopeptidase domain-containing protein n=1 Tax=Amphimedon queenslandica TaxID=400682 RepID=A0A1X7TZ50_AMPQE|nr:PREDICTED: uncharacterized protein LOC105314155 isoform X1 [Amphimedon queenslandica]|eukprot:XP_011406447.1 PREDICTED: uncharacterized protein LOC105314155 isoform X1 [Amphimedon queenslandica]